MPNLQTLADAPQGPPVVGDWKIPPMWGGESLGNARIQEAELFAEFPLSELGVEAYRVFQMRLETSSPSARLRALKRIHFPPEGAARRIARALAALNHAPAFTLTREEWALAAESIEFEEED